MNNTLPVLNPAQLAQIPAQPAWMIEHLWGHSGVGIIAGAPKSCKSWMALDIAVSVATNTLCLGKFHILTAGRVLIYMAEDSLAILFQRLKSIANHKTVDWKEINIGILSPDSLQLDNKNDQQRLENTIKEEKPVMIILDPLIRMHSSDENCSGEVSAILAYLRRLQKTYNTAVCVVHHAKKNGFNASQPGLGMRGSSDFHAWGDSNLYLKRKDNNLILAVEHRAAQSIEPLHIKLNVEIEETIHLETVNASEDISKITFNIEEKVLDLLSSDNTPITQKILRETFNVRNQTLSDALKKLQVQKKIHKSKKGWSLFSLAQSIT